MSQEKESKPYGPSIVRGWFDGVITPVLAALQVCQIYLRRRMVGWNATINNLEAIHRIEYIVGPLAEDMLHQFLRFHPDIAEHVREYEEKRKHLLDVCRTFQSALESDAQLKAIYEQLKTDDSPGDEGLVNDVFSRFTEKDHLIALATSIINNMADLPSYNSYSSFWAKHGKTFLNISTKSEYKKYIEDINKSLDELNVIIDKLKQSLKDTREKLSLEFDVPYVTSYAAIQLPFLPYGT